MDHISHNLAFGRREKIFGCKNPIRKTEKKWRPFLFFGDSKKFVGGGKKMSRGHQMGGGGGGFSRYI